MKRIPLLLSSLLLLAGCTAPAPSTASAPAETAAAQAPAAANAGDVHMLTNRYDGGQYTTCIVPSGSYCVSKIDYAAATAHSMCQIPDCQHTTSDCPVVSAGHLLVDGDTLWYPYIVHSDSEYAYALAAYTDGVTPPAHPLFAVTHYQTDLVYSVNVLAADEEYLYFVGNSNYASGDSGPNGAEAYLFSAEKSTGLQAQRLRLDTLQHLHINRKIRVALCGKACNIKFGAYIARKILVRRLPFLCLWVEENLLTQCSGNLLLRHTVKQCGHICKVDFAAFCQRQSERILWRIGVCCNNMRTDCALAENGGLADYILLIVQFFQCKQQRIPSIFSKSQFIAALMNIAELLYECIVVLREVCLQSMKLLIVTAVTLGFDQITHSISNTDHADSTFNSSSVHFGRYKIAVCFFEH